jgi:hypothetical protein
MVDDDVELQVIINPKIGNTNGIFLKDIILRTSHCTIQIMPIIVMAT